MVSSLQNAEQGVTPMAKQLFEPDQDLEAYDAAFDEVAPPDIATQIQPGERRSPGRPRGAKGKKKMVREVLTERHEVTEYGQVKRLTALEIIVRRVKHAALNGDNKAADCAAEIIERYTPPSKEPRRILAVFGEKLSEEMWQERYGHLANQTDGEVG